MTQISVIVPIYNAGKYLSRCIDSILSSTFTDFELLLINDGSKDNSAFICNDYAIKDSRIRVFHKKNGGVSSARNLGLDNARGEWVTFVDSDDWIEKTALYNILEKDDADIIVGAMHFANDQTIGTFPAKGKVEGEMLGSLLAKYIDHYSICSPCAKLFKNRIVQDNHIRFNETLTFGEDSIFVKTYLIKTYSLRIVNSLCYHYNDIGDDIYQKYSRSFIPILEYYQVMSATYKCLEEVRNIQISKHGIVGVVFNIAQICLKKNGGKELTHILSFMRDENVRKELSQRNSLHINIQLLLASLPKGYLLLFYTRFTSFIKSILK